MASHTLDELKERLKTLQQAIAVEREHQFIDIQGKRQRFSQFIVSTLSQMRFADEQLHHQCFKVRQGFEQYTNRDLGQRLYAIEQLEDLLVTLAEPFAPKAPAAPTKLDNNQPISLRNTPVTAVRGIGPQAARSLASVGVTTVHQLLHYFPKRYVDYQTQRPIHELQPDEDVTVMARIGSVSLFQAKKRPLWILTVTFVDSLGSRMQGVWFFRNMPRNVLESHKARYVKGAMAMVSGRTKLDKRSKQIQMERPEVELLDDDMDGLPNSLHAGRIVPIYPLTEGLYLRGLRKWIWQTLEEFGPHLTDPMPANILNEASLSMPLAEALRHIHFPESPEACEAARQRLAFDELFYVQARLAMVRARYKQTIPGLQLHPKTGGYVDKAKNQLPFALTNAQQRTLNEISGDLATPEPMYRLLQGDVGSGKTVVALLALLMAVDHGYQGALMAPTEILAEQHYQRFVEWLTPLGLKVGLLVGSQGTKVRREMHAGLANGQIHVAVGTHALIQDNIEFAKLGMVVIDEQHRFGVKQRMQLKDKSQAAGLYPEMLSMTATPIPRTLAMTLHGDLDVSLLDERPPGRQPIETKLYRGSGRNKAYQWINTEVLQGRQAYIVYPLIEDSETLAAKAATTEAKRLQEEVFQQWRVGLMHGKLKPDEKAAVMADFASGKLNILVSTTVVEVGVDVPNATVMMIENADRFGLSQLHQLRGRVGRGNHQSYCLLVSDSPSPETMERLQVMVATENGFEISERDLALRGPGEFLGTRQSGLPEFMLADLVTDQDLLIKARKAAIDVVTNGENLLNYPMLREAILENTEAAFGVLGSG